MHKENFILKDTFWKRIRRTPYQAIASVLMIFITLSILAIFLLLALSSSAILSYLETKPQLTIYFKDEKDKASIDKLIEKLNSTGKVASYQYISKDQALGKFRELIKNDPLTMEMVTADILPSSLEISAVSPVYLAELSEAVKNEPGIDEIVFQKEVVDTLITWTSTVRKVGLVFIIFLFIASFFILFMSIGMRIAFRKEEIEILKLVGATPWYIKRPLIFEGVIYGLIGAGSAWLIISGLVLYLRPFIAAFLHGITVLPLSQIQGLTIYVWPLSVPLFVLLLIVLLACGVSIGLVGSFLAVGRYMKY